MLLVSILAYFAVVVGLVAATIFGARVGAVVFHVPDFAWFDSRVASASPARRFGVRAASVLTAYLFCCLLTGGGVLLGGKDVSTTTVVVEPGPARDAGMRNGDRVLSVDGVSVSGWDDIRSQIRLKPRDPRTIEVERAGQRLAFRMVPDAAGHVGLFSLDKHEAVGMSEAVQVALGEPFRMASALLRSMTVDAHEHVELVGPVGIVRQSSQQRGFAAQIIFAGMLASYLLLFLIGLQLFEAVSLFLFQKTHPLAQTGERSLWRLARIQQGLVLALGAEVIGLTFVVMNALHVPSMVLMPLLFPIVPTAMAIVPLTWLSASRFWDAGRAAILMAFGVFLPCLVPLAAIALLLRVRRELRDHQFRVGLLVTTPLSE